MKARPAAAWIFLLFLVSTAWAQEFQADQAPQASPPRIERIEPEFDERHRTELAIDALERMRDARQGDEVIAAARRLVVRRVRCLEPRVAVALIHCRGAPQGS